MSLNDLAANVGISNVNLSKLKTGKVSAIRFSTLDGICRLLVNCVRLKLADEGYLADVEDSEAGAHLSRVFHRFLLTE